MIKGIIFDLDNCIFDTHSLGAHILAPILEPLLISDFSPEVKKEIQNALWTDSLEDMIDQYHVRMDVAEKMREAYRNLVVPEEDILATYGDEDCIVELTAKKYLVTSGYQKFQQSKIDRLGLQPLFDEILIDAQDKRAARKGKKKIFGEILKTNKWDAHEVLVVGDNPRSELGAAKEIGIATIQTLRSGVEKWEGADHYIYSLNELGSFV